MVVHRCSLEASAERQPNGNQGARRMALKVKELQSAKEGQWLSDGPVGSGRGSGVLLFRRTGSGALVAYFRYTFTA